MRVCWHLWNMTMRKMYTHELSIIHAIHHGWALIFEGPLKGERNFLFSIYLCWVVLSFAKKELTGRRKISESQKRVGCQSPKSFKRKFDTVATTPTEVLSSCINVHTIHRIWILHRQEQNSRDTHSQVANKILLLVKWCQIPVRKGW